MIGTDDLAKFVIEITFAELIRALRSLRPSFASFELEKIFAIDIKAVCSRWHPPMRWVCKQASAVPAKSAWVYPKHCREKYLRQWAVSELLRKWNCTFYQTKAHKITWALKFKFISKSSTYYAGEALWFPPETRLSLFENAGLLYGSSARARMRAY